MKNRQSSETISYDLPARFQKASGRRIGSGLTAVKFAVIILLLTCVYTFAAAAAHTERAGAEGGAYARIITEDTPFYSDPAGINMLFYLPYTYYVRVLDTGETLSHVECYGTGAAALDGYVPTDMLFYDGQSVQAPYANVTVTAACTAVLYEDASLSGAVQYIFEGRTMNYYGYLPESENSGIFFVSYNDKLGYVKESEVIPFTIPQHPNELTFLPQEEPEPLPEDNPAQNDEKASGGADLKLIIIVCLIFAGIIALFVVFRKKPVSAAAASGYYDENDYE